MYLRPMQVLYGGQFAPHDWEYVCAERPKLGWSGHEAEAFMVDDAIAGDRYEVWVVVGSGGGHELFVESFQFQAVYMSESAAPLVRSASS